MGDKMKYCVKVIPLKSYIFKDICKILIENFNIPLHKITGSSLGIDIVMFEIDNDQEKNVNSYLNKMNIDFLTVNY